MNIMKYLAFQICVYMIVVVNRTESQTVSRNSVLNNCQKMTSRLSDDVIAYTNWPFLLTCGTNAEAWEAYIGKIATNVTCSVVDSANTVMSSDQPIILDERTPIVTTYTLLQVYNESWCISKTVKVELRRLPNKTCSSIAINSARTNTDIVDVTVTTKTPFTLDCVSKASSILPPEGVSSSKYTTTWLRTQLDEELNPVPGSTCQDFVNHPHQDTASLITHPHKPASLNKVSVNFFDPGVYTCQVEYGGQTLAISNYFVCVQRKPTQFVQPSVTCTKEYLFFEGETLDISCDARINFGKLSDSDFTATWKREEPDVNDGITICKNENLTEHIISPVDARAVCKLVNFNNNERKCFKYVPKPTEVNGDQASLRDFTVELKLNDLKGSDAGTYTIEIDHLGQTSNDTIQLIYNNRRDLKRNNIILISCLSTLILLVLIGGLVWYCRIQILLFKRRHFGAYDNDDKEYIGIISYVHSSNMSSVNRERTKNIVTWIKEIMDKLNYKYFDKNEHYEEGFCVDTFLNKLEHSHRMIIVLTSDFVRERWARFEVNQGHKTMMENQTKLIFIRTPGALKELKNVQHSSENFSKELQQAVNACRNIKFADGMNESQFKNHVQYALPKLRREPMMSSPMYSPPVYMNFDRSMSTQTQLTEAPASPAILSDVSLHFSAGV